MTTKVSALLVSNACICNCHGRKSAGSPGHRGQDDLPDRSIIRPSTSTSIYPLTYICSLSRTQLPFLNKISGINCHLTRLSPQACYNGTAATAPSDALTIAACTISGSDSTSEGPRRNEGCRRHERPDAASPISRHPLLSPALRARQRAALFANYRPHILSPPPVITPLRKGLPYAVLYHRVT